MKFLLPLSRGVLEDAIANPEVYNVLRSANTFPDLSEGDVNSSVILRCLVCRQNIRKEEDNERDLAATRCCPSSSHHTKAFDRIYSSGLRMSTFKFGPYFEFSAFPVEYKMFLVTKSGEIKKRFVSRFVVLEDSSGHKQSFWKILFVEHNEYDHNVTM